MRKLDWYNSVDDESSYDYDYEPTGATNRVCPECGEGVMYLAGYENYGEDRDGNRGVRVPYYICNMCGYDEGGII